MGRTLPIWNTFGRVKYFTPQTPWLLRFFDQVRKQSNSMQTCGCRSGGCVGTKCLSSPVAALQATLLRPSYPFIPSVCGNRFLKSVQFCKENHGCCVQVRFFEVSEAELGTQRELFRTGRLQIKIEDVEFSMKCGPWLHFLI